MRTRKATSASEPFGIDESVAQCLSILDEILIAQRERTRHLDVKAGSIAGFATTALTLSLTLGRPLLLQHFASTRWAHGLIRDAFVLSALMFASAAVVAVGVLRPMGTNDLTEEAIDSYADRPKVITPPAELRLTWVQTVSQMALGDRAVGNAKARRSRTATRLLSVGVLGLLVQVVTLAIAS